MELLGRFPASLVYRGKVGCPCSRLQCITLYADVGLAWLLGEAPKRCLLSPVQRASRNLPTGTPAKRKPSRRAVRSCVNVIQQLRLSKLDVYYCRYMTVANSD